MKKRIVLVAICVLIISSLFALSASANSYWYVINQPDAKGATVSLTGEYKEYTHVSVNTDSGLNVRVSLYSPKLFSDTWYGNDQILNYGTDRRAWWVGDTTGTKNYYISTKTLSNVMTLSGYFKNF